MATDHRAKLASIKRFDQLIAYLRDEMRWPIESDDFEEVTFDYSPEELGIDPKNAAKIQEIKRLRPLVANQPWGVFFIKFAPKRLPVLALRRILGAVALKKRSRAGSADRPAWAPDDLLFVSNYGEADERQITFAHFQVPQNRDDLPTLKVLGWDNRDTVLHLGKVATELTEHLAWPRDDSDLDGWRRQWRKAFSLGHQEVIRTAKELSLRLAELAGNIRDRIGIALKMETATGPLHALMDGFKKALLHDLNPESFADMYAQTIAYGLLSARIEDPSKKTTDDLAAHMRTNPFLRELMETFLKIGGRTAKAGGPGIDFDELGVSEVVDALDNARMEDVLRDFGDKNPQEDPVIHFYEHFLAAYDKKQKVRRGVFYTPRPVVSFIVRSVDELLRTELGLADGLADTTTWGEMAERHTDCDIPEGVLPQQDFVQILDPATGTGTFLVEVIDLIYKTLAAKWSALGHDEKTIASLWNQYVAKHLLTRLHGYELLMAPYAIAHLKIGLKLFATGYRFESEERARVYLTNALEPARTGQLSLDIAPALAHEAQAVNAIKRDRRFTVVLGNPPYSGHSANASRDEFGHLTWIGRLIEDYKQVDGKALKEKQPKWLQDDYVKFLRFASFEVSERASQGIIGFVTNHSYLDNPTFRGMRQAWMTAFDDLWLYDLHGNSKKAEREPGGGRDDNVFDIQQGVAILLACRTAVSASRPVDVFHANAWGRREPKYEELSQRSISLMQWIRLEPTSPFYLFVPQDISLSAEYEHGVGLSELMPVSSIGIVSGREALTYDLDREALLQRVSDFCDRHHSDSWIRSRFGIRDAGGYELAKRRKLVLGADPNSLIKRLSMRPFDTRWVAFSRGLLTADQFNVMQHLVGGNNVALITTRQTKESWGACVAKYPVAHKAIAAYDATSVFPLHLHEGEDALGIEAASINLSSSGLKRLMAAISVRPGIAWPEPLDVLSYVYAIFHSNEYRARYRAFLKIDYPRVPVPTSRALFDSLSHLGGTLMDVHLVDSLDKVGGGVEFIGDKRTVVGRICWSGDTVWLNGAGSAGFRGVSGNIWNFHIGGYQVCEKWLKDRKGRTLSKDDIAHYQKIVVALGETIRLMKKIDGVIEEHGGWPGAFLTGGSAAATERAGTDDIPIQRPAVQYDRPDVPLRKVAERRQHSGPEDGDSDNQEDDSTSARESILDLATNELMCRLRSLFGNGGARDRETAVKQLAEDCGHSRLGPRIREAADNAIRAAVRRGVLENVRGELDLCAGSIDGYTRKFLKQQFLASLEGYDWEDRDESIRRFARWMGFRRTGKSISDTAKSLISGLIRQGRLVSDGPRIRRTLG
jgi:hypothetical protein